MIINRIIQITTFILGITVFSTTASAADRFAFGGLDSSCFSYPAVAMTPYNASSNSYQSTHSRVYFKGNNLRTILLYGHVQMPSNSFGDSTRFKVSYRDPDGSGKRSQVYAELRFIGDNGIEPIAFLHSDSHARITDDVQTMSKVVDWQKLRKKNGYYIVRVYISRADANISPAAFGYNLCSAFD